MDIQEIRSVDGISGWNESEGVYDVVTPHALSQVAGCLKFLKSDNGRVFFRGQAKTYTTMTPSLFRTDKGIRKITQKVMSDRVSEIKKFMDRLDCDACFVGKTPDYAYEPLLQQYGFRTRWIDCVDNIWIALWFATHEANFSGLNKEYINYEKNKNEYSYIYLMQFGEENPVDRGLTITGSEFKIVDLRVATPSNYIRPHSQNGILVSRKAYRNVDDIDFYNFVVGIIRVRTSEAIQWQGGGLLASVHFVFPPPRYDVGYGRLINSALKGNRLIGKLQFIGP